MKCVDLHIHSTASDGVFSCEELICIASKKNLGAIAITDHESLEGVSSFLKYDSHAYEVDLIPGIEISAEVGLGQKIHIVGLWVDSNIVLQKELNVLKNNRLHRNEKIIRRWERMDIGITKEDLKVKFGKILLGRSHFAQILVAKKIAKNIQSAFQERLSFNQYFYLRKRVNVARILFLLRLAGGVPILAHPWLLDFEKISIDLLLKELFFLGLEGIEVYNDLCFSKDFNRFKKWANYQNLVLSGGSDFHGEVKPFIKLGMRTGDSIVPSLLLAKLKRRRVMICSGKKNI